VLNIPTQASCFSKVETLSSGTRASEQHETGTFALNIYDLLRKSEFYQSYASMYDEFKIDNVKVKLIPTKYNVTVGDGESGYQSFTVYTAWDRTGLNSNQLFLSVNNSDTDGFIGSNSNSNSGLYCTVGSDITTYSSAESRQISIGQNSTIVRWLKPKTIQEKSQWISTSQLKAWSYKYNEAKGCYQQIPISSRNATDGTKDLDIISTISQNHGSFAFALSDISPAVSNNPCFLEEDPTINFKPTLLVGIYPVENNQERPRTVSFNIEAEVSCSFRGLRKSKVVSSSSNPAPTPTPTINNQPVTRTIRTFNDSDAVVELNSLPNGVTGYYPINVNCAIDFHRSILDQNNTFYKLNKIQPTIGQSTTPYYQLEPHTGVVTPETLDIAYVSIKAKTVDSVVYQQGSGQLPFLRPISDFTLLESSTSINVGSEQCLTVVDKNDTNGNYMLRYYFNTGVEGTRAVELNTASNHTIHYYKEQVTQDSDIRSIPNSVSFGYVEGEPDHESYYVLVEIDNPSNDTSNYISCQVSQALVDFDFSDMDVDPNTKSMARNIKIFNN
jgi:hypothetical protein